MPIIQRKKKRKEKPKSGRRWSLRLIIGLLISIFLSAIVLFLYTLLATVDRNKCAFESNPHIFVESRERNYITNSTGDTLIELPGDFISPQWQSNSPYVWSIGEKIFALNLDTLKLHAFDKPDAENIQWEYSPTMRFLVAKTNGVDLSEITIFDGLSHSVVSQFQTENFHDFWTPDEHIALFYSPNVVDAQLFDPETQVLSSITLPSDIQWMREWIDREQLIYVTPAGRFRIWNRLTEESDTFADFRVAPRYIAGGQEFVNSHGRWQWVGGIDTDDNFQLRDIENGDEILFPVDLSEPFLYIIYPQYILFDYLNAETRKLKIYQFDTEELVTFTFPLSESPNLSHNGKYLLYDLGDSRDRNIIIQDIISGLETPLDKDILYGIEWVAVDDVAYLLYALRTDEGNVSHHLLRPDTGVQCIIGELNATSVEIQY